MALGAAPLRLPSPPPKARTLKGSAIGLSTPKGEGSHGETHVRGAGLAQSPSGGPIGPGVGSALRSQICDKHTVVCVPSSGNLAVAGP